MEGGEGGDVDVEWFAVEKEQKLAAKCAIAAPTASKAASKDGIAGADTDATTPSFFWTLMSQVQRIHILYDTTTTEHTRVCLETKAGGVGGCHASWRVGGYCKYDWLWHHFLRSLYQVTHYPFCLFGHTEWECTGAAWV